MFLNEWSLYLKAKRIMRLTQYDLIIFLSSYWYVTNKNLLSHLLCFTLYYNNSYDFNNNTPTWTTWCGGERRERENIFMREERDVWETEREQRKRKWINMSKKWFYKSFIVCKKKRNSNTRPVVSPFFLFIFLVPVLSILA